MISATRVAPVDSSAKRPGRRSRLKAAKYDSRNRPIARTVWLVARGTVDVNNPPIAGDPGIAAAEGLTTRWQYDENCTDNAGLDATFSAHFAGLGLGANADGSAVLVTNPAGVTVWSIAWVLTQCQPRANDHRFGTAMTVGLLVEVGLITLQYWRGSRRTSTARPPWM